MRLSACTLIAATLVAAPACFARTHTVRPLQDLTTGYSQNFGLEVAIDGDSIITFADYFDGRVALLYRRGTDGRWAFSRILLDLVTGGTPPSRNELAMKNGLAAIRLGSTVFISEKINGE